VSPGQRPSRSIIGWVLVLTVSGLLAVVFTWLAVTAAIAHGRAWWPALIGPIIGGVLGGVGTILARGRRGQDADAASLQRADNGRWILVAILVGVALIGLAVALVGAGS